MSKFKFVFQLKDDRGNTGGKAITEIVEAPDVRVASELLRRKYGDLQIWQSISIHDAKPNRERGSSESSQANSPTTNNSGLGGCLAVIGAIGIVIAASAGLIKFDSESVSPVSNKSEQQNTKDNTAAEISNQATYTERTPDNQQLWGAISANSSNQTWQSTSYPTEEDAKSAALNACGDSSCSIIASFGRGSVAVVESDSKWYVNSGKSSENEAKSAAMNDCQSNEPDGNCS